MARTDSDGDDKVVQIADVVLAKTEDGAAPSTPEARRSEGLRHERAVGSKQYRDGFFHNTSGVEPRLGKSRSSGASDGIRVGAGMSTGSMLREWLFGGQQRRPPMVLPVERPHDAWTK